MYVCRLPFIALFSDMPLSLFFDCHSAFKKAANNVVGPAYSDFSTTFSLSLPLIKAFKPHSETDMTSALNSVAASKLQVIFVISRADQLMKLVRQMATLNMQKDNKYVLLTVNSVDASMLAWATAQNLADLNTIMEGIISVNPASDESNIIASNMAAQCRLDLPRICNTPSPLQFLAYDAVMLAARALDKATAYSAATGLATVPNPSHEAVTEHLFSQQFAVSFLSCLFLSLFPFCFLRASLLILFPFLSISISLPRVLREM